MGGKLKKATAKLVSVGHVPAGHPAHTDKLMVTRKLVLNTSTAARVGALHGALLRATIKMPSGAFFTPLVWAEVSDLRAHPKEFLTEGPSFDFALDTEHTAYR